MLKNDVKIFPHNIASKGARGLATSLGVRRLKDNIEESTFRGGKGKVVINWGAGRIPKEFLTGVSIINPPRLVTKCANKLDFFELQSTVKDPPRLPEWTTKIDEALRWIKTEKAEVCARTLLNSHSGRGIVFFSDDPKRFAMAELFTKYKKKKEEYRVHIAFGEIIDFQKKVLRSTDDNGNPIDKNDIDFRIRTHENGFIFVRSDVRPPEDVFVQARKSYTASKLDFGAIDVIWNDHEQQAYVLEINTAPGIEGTTLENYTAAFKKQFSL